MLKKAFTVGTTLILAWNAPALCDTPTILDLAPESTFFVLHVPETAASMERFHGTALWDLWESEEFAETRTKMIEKEKKFAAVLLDRLDMDEEDIVWPSGSMGVSVFVSRDPELGTALPGVLISADYGEDAGKAQEWLDKSIEVVEENGEIEYETREVLDRTVHCFKIPVGDEDPEADFGGPGMGPGRSMLAGTGPWEMVGDMVEEAMDEVFIVREGSVFLAASDVGSLERALEVHDGGEPTKLSQRDDHRKLAQSLEGGDAYFGVYFRTLVEFMAANDEMGMMMMVGPMIKQTLGDISAFAGSMQFDEDGAMVDTTVKVYMPMGKAGITALMNEGSPIDAVPSFVAPDAHSFSRTNFRFKGLADALMPVINMVQMMAPPQEGQPRIDELVRQATANLGDRLWMTQIATRPLDTNSSKQLLAVACENPQGMEAFIGGFGAQMGMEGRDFLGHRLYTMDAGMMPMGGGGPGMPGGPTEPMAIGFAGPTVFMGPNGSVEQALRSIGQGDVPTLADEPDFKRAVAMLPGNDLVGWGWIDIITSGEVAAAVQRVMYEETMADLEDDPELRAELEELGLDEPTWESEVDYDVIRKYLGPYVWQMEAVEDGFVHRSFWLPAAE